MSKELLSCPFCNDELKLDPGAVGFATGPGLSGERYDFARTVFEAAIASPDAPALTAIAAKSNINCK